MKTCAKTGGIAIAALALGWLAHRLHPPAEPGGGRPTNHVASGAAPETPHGLSPPAAPAVATGALSGTSLPPVALAAPPASEWATIEALLARPQHRPLMREVPRLRPENEARLVALYRKIGPARDKEHIVRMLAFGGGSAAAQVFRETLTKTYAGKSVPPEDDAILSYMPELCGVLAHRNDDALRFLLDASRPEFWLAQRLWESDVRHVSVRILTGACIAGLGLSARQEAREVLDWYRNHPEEVRVTEPGGTEDSLEGSVVYAAFMMAIVQDLGIEAAMDDVFYDPDVMLRRFREWLKTPEGVDWYGWARRAESVVSNARKQTNSARP